MSEIDFDDFFSSAGSSMESVNDSPEVPEIDEEKPKKRRGRPPGSGKRKPGRPRKSEEPEISIPTEMVQSAVDIGFRLVVSIAGSRWAPYDSEVRTISESLRSVLEKRLPDTVRENFPEYMLALCVIGYVGRCYVAPRHDNAAAKPEE